MIEGKSQFVSATGKGVDVTREEYPAFISTHLTGTRPLSVTKQRGQTFETPATTTADESLPFKCVNTTTTTTSPDESLPFKQLVATTNPFYTTTESSGDHMCQLQRQQ